MKKSFDEESTGDENEEMIKEDNKNRKDIMTKDETSETTQFQKERVQKGLRLQLSQVNANFDQKGSQANKSC
jgi:hypothetical protein